MKYFSAFDYKDGEYLVLHSRTKERSRIQQDKKIFFPTL